MAGVRPWAPGQAQAATTPDTPAYLLRSSYQSLSTKSFGTSLRGQTNDLTLESVADLAAAASDKSLAGSEDAFALSFSANSPLTAETHTFSHPDLGVFELFIAPVERGGAYEVVVNRSVNAPKHYPPPPRSTDGPVAPPKQETKPPAGVKKPLVRRLGVRRVGRAVVAEITFNGSVDLKSATAWLTRNGVVVAAATAKHVHGHRGTVRLAPRRRPRGGRYTLTVATNDRHGHVEYKAARITLQ